MSEPLNILHLEDSDADFLLIGRALKKQGLAVRQHRVMDMADLMAGLDSADWHLVISDYDIPGLAFDDTLSVVRRCRPDLPYKHFRV